MTESQNLKDTPWMRLGANAEVWLPDLLRVLAASRPSRKVDTVALINGFENNQYLVTLWWRQYRDGTRGNPYIDFHKVLFQSNGQPHLKFLRRVKDWSVSLVKPTGLPLSEMGAPVAIIEKSGGGSGYENDGLRIFEMRNNTIDITPDWAGRITDVIDMDGDGKAEIGGIDDRWEGAFDTRGAAGPHLPLILSGKSRRFVAACHDHAKVLLRTVERNETAMPHYPYDCAQAEKLSENILIYAQIGEFARARELLINLEALLKPAEGRCFTTASEAVSEFTEMIDSAERVVAQHPKAQCLVSATSLIGSHTGADARSEYFKSLATHE